jgi:hypothetical protein
VCRAEVNLQLSDRTAQRIPVYAKFPGRLALIFSLILEHSEDETLLKLPYRFRASHTDFIHLQDNTLSLFLHSEFPLTESSATGGGLHSPSHNLGRPIERGTSQEGKEKAVTLVML